MEKKDVDYSIGGKYKKKESVLVELPKDISNIPDIVAMLDRTGQKSRQAVGIVSTILKTGKNADLSDYVYTMFRLCLDYV